ncbi:MAG: hypothetical protein JW924_04200 [Fusobacteriaceae bacterium]|nr:hypothetical protein [Fusobacteriaceae bacterium]
MKKLNLLLIGIFMVVSVVSFGATRKSNEIVINTQLNGELGLGIEGLTKSQNLIYGIGGYFSFDDYYDNYYYDTDVTTIGVYGVLGTVLPQTKVKILGKLGLDFKNYDYGRYGDNSDSELMFGVALGIPLNNSYDLFIEGNTDRGLVLGLGFK